MGGKKLPAPLVPLWILIVLIGVAVVVIRFRVDKPDGGIKEKETYSWKDDENMLISWASYDKKGNLQELEIYDEEDPDAEEALEKYRYSYKYDKDDRITGISCEADCKDADVSLEAEYDDKDGVLTGYTLIYEEDGKETRRVDYDGHMNQIRDRRFSNGMTAYMEDRCYDSVGRMIRQEVFTVNPVNGTLILNALLEFRYETEGMATSVYVKDYFAKDDEEFLGKYLETDDRGRLVVDESYDAEDDEKVTSYSEYKYYK